MRSNYKIIITGFALLFFAKVCSSQSIEQLQELRRSVASQQNSPSVSGNAPSTITGDRQLPSASPQSSLGQFNQAQRQGLVLPGEATIDSVFPLQEKQLSPPFAANLFLGGYETERDSGLNDNYIIAPGDKISIWLWGAVNYSDVVTVDNQGNIFIPNVGPIALSGTSAQLVNTKVSNEIRKIYTRDVNIYVNLLTSTPVSIFVSGPVLRPGQYAGQANDSLLYFLKRAGGIDFLRGSFRSINIVRQGETIESIDLYDFYVSGVLPQMSFKDGDVILVEEIKDTVIVTSGARNSFTFEFSSNNVTGKEVIEYAKPTPFISHVSLAGLRENGQFAAYYSLEEFSNTTLNDGDTIEFLDDHETQVYRINIAGSFLGPSQYMVPRGAKLHDLLHMISIDKSLSDYKNVYLLRESVAIQQREMLNQALDRLERSVFTAPVSSSGEGAIRAQEAQLVTDFVARARQIEPLGKVVISENGSTADLLLEPNDTIVIPAVSDVINIGGEVMLPQAVVFNADASITDYIAWAGGYSTRADDERMMIIRNNGTVVFTDSATTSWLLGENSIELLPGDRIVVLPKIDAKTMQAVKDITQIIFQIAVAANAIID